MTYANARQGGPKSTEESTLPGADLGYDLGEDRNLMLRGVSGERGWSWLGRGGGGAKGLGLRSTLTAEMAFGL